MKTETKAALIRLTALAIAMIPYRWKKEGETTLCRSLLFRYEYDRRKAPALKIKRNK